MAMDAQSEISRIPPRCPIQSTGWMHSYRNSLARLSGTLEKQMPIRTSQRNQALFIRWLVVSPHRKQRATRYGSRENSAFFFFWLSVRIVSETSCGVGTVQVSHCSTFSFALWSVRAIVRIHLKPARIRPRGPVSSLPADKFRRNAGLSAPGWHPGPTR